MYVCICNVVTEDDVYGCMANGCTTAKEVKAACGFKPGCGMCTKRIHTMVSEYRTANELADALTGGPLPLAAVPEPPLPAAPSAAPSAEAHVPEARVPEAPATPPAAEDTEGGTAPQTAA
ncbi:(2Fe-2S)-binding protein [Actinomadura welshii]